MWIIFVESTTNQRYVLELTGEETLEEVIKIFKKQFNIEHPSIQDQICRSLNFDDPNTVTSSNSKDTISRKISSFGLVDICTLEFSNETPKMTSSTSTNISALTSTEFYSHDELNKSSQNLPLLLDSIPSKVITLKNSQIPVNTTNSAPKESFNSALDELLSRGFPEDDAQAALKKTNCNLKQALNLLLNGFTADSLNAEETKSAEEKSPQ